MEALHRTRRSREKGLCPTYFQKWVFILYYMIFIDFLSNFERFWSFLEDLGPFFRPDIGGKLGVYYPLQAYINQRF
jgi:hypothetical protein